jgi:putative transposase
MGQSFFQFYGHLIFSTKNRVNFLDGNIRARVHSYLAGILRNLDSKYVVVGGVEDHIHILYDCPKMLLPATLIEKIKKDSSKFIKTLGHEYTDFYWQRGYGLFSVGKKQRGDVEKYILNQEDHHRKISFQDEYRRFLKRYEIEFDECYVWD